MWPNHVIYEQPGNEHIRACLRLELAFSQLDHFMKSFEPVETRAAVFSLVSIINILDRPDLKGKLTSEINRHIGLLNSLRNNHSVNQKKLSLLIDELESLQECFEQTTGKFSLAFKDNEFLYSIRQHLSSAGGGGSFDVPAFHFWLEQFPQIRHKQLKDWLIPFKNVRRVAELILQLTRENYRSELCIAQHGFYQITLNPMQSCQLIRIGVPNYILTYPEISLGKHRLTIRFLSPDFNSRPSPYVEDVSFYLAKC